MNRKTLLVFYSRTGTTRLVAEAISAALACDVEEIVDTTDRHGIVGYLRSGFGAAFRRLTTLKPLRFDPSNYGLVIVGTPVWNASVSVPVRTYLTMHKGRFTNVAFFCTYGGAGSRRVFQQMADTCGVRPLDLLDVREAEVKSGDYTRRLHTFVASLTSGSVAA